MAALPVLSNGVAEMSVTSAPPPLAHFSDAVESGVFRAKPKNWSKASLRRSSERQRAFIAAKDPDRPVHALSVSLEDAPRTGEFQGRAYYAKPAEAPVVMKAGDGWPNTRGAALLDRAGRLIGLRAFGCGDVPLQINSIAIAAVEKLERSTRPQHGPGHKRGLFSARLFSIHRTQTSVPSHNAYMLENLEQVKEFASDIKPIVDYAEGGQSLAVDGWRYMDADVCCGLQAYFAATFPITMLIIDP
ncbi:hypothetical protein FS837_000771 [Tulasnella sp. UAMH 9824]|nr:hypothetical protein FS837_000771 [Tulasnella sp. UAMH 9824]